MSKIRVLVVDDAALVRKMVSDALSEDPAIDVCGVAQNGSLALQKIPLTNPDIITLDVEMPEMNGIETVKAIRSQYPKLPIIMFSAHTETGAKETLEALAQGANDYVTKPSKSEGIDAAKAVIRKDLGVKIKELCRIGIPAKQPASQPKTAPRRKTEKPKILAIGVSTGGPNALSEVIPKIPKDFPIPIVITQHMPPLFTKMLAQRLSEQSNIPVYEAEEGMSLEAGKAYIAPGDFHMTIQKDPAGGTYIALNQEEKENSCRPAVDPMLRSVVAAYGAATLTVILTGMGADGLKGCQLVKEEGGTVLVQDEATSVVWGMPGVVANAGLADAVLPVSEIYADIERRGVKG